MFTHENLIWVKNVTRKQGAGWAYDDKKCGKPFWLNWPSKWRKSADTPQVGDIILLFQKPNVINGVRNYDVHLTHLVTPVSIEVRDDADNPNHRWCRKVMPIAVANPLNSIPNVDYFNFYKPNRGQTHPIKNLGNRIGLTLPETQSLIFDLFSGFFCPGVEIATPVPQRAFDHPGWIEGDKKLKRHVELELTVRSAAAVRAAKVKAFREGNGRVFCACCKFDFLARYGKHGAGYIEAHHKKFISHGTRLTRPEDLALVCANCHRMLHTKKDNGDYPTVEEIAELFRLHALK